MDYLGWGRYPLDLKHCQVLTPGNMAPLTDIEDSEGIPHDARGPVEPLR